MILILVLSFVIVILISFMIVVNIKWQKDIIQKQELEKKIKNLQQLNFTKKNLEEEIRKLEIKKEELNETAKLLSDGNNTVTKEIIKYNQNIKELIAEIGTKTEELRLINAEYSGNLAQLEKLKLLLDDWSNTKNIAEKERTAPLLCAEKSRIILDESEIAQIKILRDIMPLLSGTLSRNLAKALWETLYRPKLAALEAAWGINGRVSGIYKITVWKDISSCGNDVVYNNDFVRGNDVVQDETLIQNCIVIEDNDLIKDKILAQYKTLVQDGMNNVVIEDINGAVQTQSLPAPQVLPNRRVGLVYIGQSVDIGKRWYDHAKRALGVDDPTRGKLYPAMREVGLENCTWEVIEECAENMLNEKEKYWIAYYGADKYGLNSTKGGS